MELLVGIGWGLQVCAWGRPSASWPPLSEHLAPNGLPSPQEERNPWSEYPCSISWHTYPLLIPLFLPLSHSLSHSLSLSLSHRHIHAPMRKQTHTQTVSFLYTCVCGLNILCRLLVSVIYDVQRGPYYWSTMSVDQHRQMDWMRTARGHSQSCWDWKFHMRVLSPGAGLFV